MEDAESEMAMEREDGELEDGELDEDEDTDAMPNLPPAHTPVSSAAESFHRSPPLLSAQGDMDYRKADIDYRMQCAGGDASDFGSTGERKPGQTSFAFGQEEPNGARRMSRDASLSGESDGSDEEGKRRRRDKRRDKKEKRKRKHEERKKKKKKYHDFDSMADERSNSYKPGDDPYMSNWPGYTSGKRDRGYDSPGSKEGSPGYYERDNKDPRARGSPRPYGSPYNSPPGPYDSPDEEEEYNDGRRKSKYARFSRGGSQEREGRGMVSHEHEGRSMMSHEHEGRSMMSHEHEGRSMMSHEHEGRSMLSLVGDDYFDANVAANEKEELFDRAIKNNRLSNKQLKKMEKAKKYKDLQKQREKENAERDQKRREERKRQPCRYYQDGNCPRGDDCEFSHDVAKRELSHKKALCKHYMRGGCNRDWCVFMHGDYPCKYYFQNRCEMGDKCRFTHGEMSDETRLILDRDEREVSPKRNGQVRKPGHDKPSILGEPPKYVQETMKKIPSLFDIKVEKPKKPTNQNMIQPNMGPSAHSTMSPNQRPVRPGFYSDILATPPRMSHSGPPPGAGLLGPAPRPPGSMQGMNMPPPGYMGPRPGPPPAFLSPANFFGPMGPPPGMMGPMGMTDGQEGAQGQHDNKENSLETGNVQQHGRLPPDDWIKEEKGDSWFGTEDDTVSDKPAQPKIDISAMLTMIRNSVVASSSSSPQQQTTQTQASAARDPRNTSVGNDPRSSSFGNDPRANRQDPRAGNRDAPREVETRAVAEPPAVQTEATFGFAQNQAKEEAEKSYDCEKIINGSLSYTGGMPYFLYKISLDVLRPMLPKSVDPTDEKYADDPRVKRYGRLGQTVLETEPKMIRPRSRHSSTDNNSDLRTKVTETRVVVTPPKPKPDSLPISLGFQEAPKVDEIKAVSLPEGLKKPLIPLPKLLDPRLGRQLSMEVEKKQEKGQQKSPPAANKPAQPFSHRHDPRFKKKSKGRSNSSGESENLQHQNSHDQSASLETDITSPEKSGDSSDKTAEATEEKEESKSVCDTLLKSENYEQGEEVVKSGRRENPMEYATPLGYYSETREDDSYNSYNPRTASNHKDTSTSTDSSQFRFQNDPRSRNRDQTVATSNSVTSAFSDSTTTSVTSDSAMAAVYSVAHEAVEEANSYLPMKDMFKTIDPTASPFGSIS